MRRGKLETRHLLTSQEESGESPLETEPERLRLFST